MQQRTSVLPATHPVRALLGLAKQIALPHEHSPERFPSFPALERTALMGFNSPATLNLPATTAVKVLVSRQATYPVWAQQTVSGAGWDATWQYDYVNHTIAANPGDIVVGKPQLSYWQSTNVAGTTKYPGITGLTNSIGPYSIMAMDYETGPVAFMWVPDGFNCYVVAGTQGSNSAATTVGITLEQWIAPGEIQQFGLSGSIGAGTTATMIAGPSTASGGYWVRPGSIALSFAAETMTTYPMVAIFAVAGTVAYTASGVNLGLMTVTPVASTGLYPLVMPSEFANSQIPWQSTRTTATAFLGTNVTQVLNKGGTVLAGRVAPQVVNPFTVGSAYINSLHPAEKAFLPLETGVYTYCPPSTDLVNFWDYTLGSGGQATPCPVYRLDNNSLVNVMFVTAAGAVESLAVNVDWHIEFRTSSALFQIGMSAITLETLHQAQISLASVGFFFENPKHSTILNSVVSAAKKYGPSALGLVNPVAGRVAATAVKMLSNKPNSQMKSTSAANSGISRPPSSRPKNPAKPKPKAKNKKKGARA